MKQQRFTLTMWDVKETPVWTVVGGQRGFTLTMWDVKKASEDEEWDAAAFYLNYVGCKAFI